jgi:hypothetical protein
VNENRSDVEEIASLRSRLADFAMAMDLLFLITESASEDQAIDRVFDLFVDLCGPALTLLVPIRDGAENEPVWRPRSDPLPLGAMESVRALKGDHAWTPSEEGFVLRIRHGNNAVGVLLLDGLAAPNRREEYLNLALAVTSVLALVMSNTRVHERLEAAARTDELTGVPNRRAVMERLTELPRAVDTGHATSDCVVRCSSYSIGGRYSSELWNRDALYQLSQPKISRRASCRVAKCSPSTTSRLKLEKNDSAIALS